MSMLIDIRQLAARFDELLALAKSGAEIILTDGSNPRARLHPVAAPPNARVPGLHAGAIQTTPDFDAPLPDEFWAA
jgi:antitoxin (DNA-binding transcriptional repressor) of toxin-antitoxin stability system